MKLLVSTVFWICVNPPSKSSSQNCPPCFVNFSFFVFICGFIFCDNLFLWGLLFTDMVPHARMRFTLLITLFDNLFLWGLLYTDLVPHARMGFIPSSLFLYSPSLICDFGNFCQKCPVGKGFLLFVCQPVFPIWFCYW